MALAHLSNQCHAGASGGHKSRVQDIAVRPLQEQCEQSVASVVIDTCNNDASSFQGANLNQQPDLN